MVQELAGGLYNPVPQGMKNVEAIAGDPVLLAPKAPQPRGKVSVQRGQGGKQSPLVRGQHLLLRLRRRLHLPMLNIMKMIIPLLVFLALFGGESWRCLWDCDYRGFISH